MITDTITDYDERSSTASSEKTEKGIYGLINKQSFEIVTRLRLV